MTENELREKVNEIIRRSLQPQPLSTADIDLLICYIDLLEYKVYRNAVSKPSEATDDDTMKLKADIKRFLEQQSK